MILVRIVFQAKHGKAGEMVAGMKGVMKQIAASSGQPAKARLLTDLSGPFDTVVLEIEHANLAAAEQARALMFTTPEYQDNQPRTQDLIISGHQEYYTIEVES